MAFLIGVDEAGYGPNLGPLLVTGTCWRCEHADADLYKLLAASISPQVCAGRLAAADSKQIYRGKKIQELEQTVLAVLAMIVGTVPRSIQELTDAVIGESVNVNFGDHFWLKNAEVNLPREADWKDVAAAASFLQETCQKNSVQLEKVESIVVLPTAFNQKVKNAGNKATMLTSETLGLAAGLLELTAGDVNVEFDKHGGRNYYLAALHHHLTRQPIHVKIESRSQSVYQWQEPVKSTEKLGLKSDRQITARFSAQGEGNLAVALASMISKYVREIYMIAWNQFWSAELPSLKPTKGYPQDAKRFLKDIEGTCKKLGIKKETFWRSV